MIPELKSNLCRQVTCAGNCKILFSFREDSHKRKCFFSGRTTKRGGGRKPPKPLLSAIIFIEYLDFTPVHPRVLINQNPQHIYYF